MNIIEIFNNKLLEHDKKAKIISVIQLWIAVIIGIVRIDNLKDFLMVVLPSLTITIVCLMHEPKTLRGE